ncbi:uncharacterized protein LY89DRAFT_677109 [Mollisia scopiformis]|uniref:Uncharacterized protein n=1 Tax=Mollisia scopiformis TaxID=149040 RepID=A0A132B8A0_MOLSC|nr:uncharacterized protein LY89DRAFT_677109 [Mollisia scopiformis]KUJ08219.1 hypothetical protein LY89DRAFT_677109 [Mollisia scopiformis]
MTEVRKQSKLPIDDHRILSVYQSSNQKPHSNLELSKSHKETQKFTTSFLSQTTRVGGLRSGLVSWPNITIQESRSQRKGIFHYVAEEVTRLILQDQTTRKSIQDLIGNYDPAYFEKSVPRIFTAFIENLVLEANSLLEVARKRESLERKGLGFWARMRSSKEKKADSKRLSAFKATRLSVAEMLNMIWQYRAPIWDSPKRDEQGRNYWASNVEAVRESKSFGIFKEDLRSLKRPFIDTEAVGFEMVAGRRMSGSEYASPDDTRNCESKGLTKQEFDLRPPKGLLNWDCDIILPIPEALKEITRLTLYSEPIKKAIFSVLDCPGESYFQKHIRPLLNRFLEDLWLEKWWQLKPRRKSRTRTRSGHSLTESLWSWRHDRSRKLTTMPYMMGSERASVVDVMNMIWCVESKFWSSAKRDIWGNTCSRNHEIFVRESTALQIFMDGLKALRKTVVAVEAI